MPLEKVILCVPQVLTSILNKGLFIPKADALVGAIINDKDTQALTKTLDSLANQSKAAVDIQDKVYDNSKALCDETIKFIRSSYKPKTKLSNASKLFYHQG